MDEEPCDSISTIRETLMHHNILPDLCLDEFYHL